MLSNAVAIELKPIDLFLTEQSKIDKACDLGYKSTNPNPPNYGTYTVSGVPLNGYHIQSLEGTAFIVCRNQAIKLKDKVVPDSVVLPLYVSVAGFVNDPSDAKRWAVGFMFYDKDGKELGKIANGNAVDGWILDNWKISCNSGCGWNGQNDYKFIPRSLKVSELDMIKKAHSMSLIISAGDGIRIFPLSKIREYDKFF